MNKYRKKPVVIEAARLTLEEGRQAEIVDWAGKHHIRLHVMPSGSLIIPTMEGDMIAQVGDYIIKGVKDEFYPCKPDIFEATYDAVEE